MVKNFSNSCHWIEILNDNPLKNKMDTFILVILICMGKSIGMKRVNRIIEVLLKYNRKKKELYHTEAVQNKLNCMIRACIV